VLELLTQTFNASVIAVTQLFLSTVVSSNPWFENLDLQYIGLQKEIICNTKLAESFTETLDDVLVSGKNITLHFKFDLMAAGEAEPIQSKEVINGFRYDEETDVYLLVNSEDRKVERYFTIDEAKTNYVSIQNLSVVSTGDLSADQDYFIRVTAFLDPIKMDNMSESVNLMLRWASVKPTIVSDKFRIAAKAT
jgi:hypothetical protein